MDTPANSPTGFFHNHKRLTATLLLITAIGMIPIVNAASKETDRSIMVLTTTCSTLTGQTTSVPLGSSGTILFTCANNPALQVIHKGQAVPEFVLPKGYVILSITPHVPGAKTCSLGPTLATNHSFQFSRLASFDYCASYSNAPSQGLASFSLTWAAAHEAGQDHEHEHADHHEQDQRNQQHEEETDNQPGL